jgi:chromosome segregation ATPase
MHAPLDDDSTWAAHNAVSLAGPVTFNGQRLHAPYADMLVPSAEPDHAAGLLAAVEDGRVREEALRRRVAELDRLLSQIQTDNVDAAKSAGHAAQQALAAAKGSSEWWRKKSDGQATRLTELEAAVATLTAAGDAAEVAAAEAAAVREEAAAALAETSAAALREVEEQLCAEVKKHEMANGMDDYETVQAAREAAEKALAVAECELRTAAEDLEESRGDTALKSVEGQRALQQKEGEMRDLEQRLEEAEEKGNKFKSERDSYKHKADSLGRDALAAAVEAENYRQEVAGAVRDALSKVLAP